MDSRSISQKALMLTDRLPYRFFLAFLIRIVVGRLLSLAWNNRLIFSGVDPRLGAQRTDPLSDFASRQCRLCFHFHSWNLSSSSFTSAPQSSP
jgi:hypothetical protein